MIISHKQTKWDISNVQAWRMETQMHDLHPHQMLTKVIFQDRPDTETFLFGQMINSTHCIHLPQR